MASFQVTLNNAFAHADSLTHTGKDLFSFATVTPCETELQYLGAKGELGKYPPLYTACPKQMQVHIFRASALPWDGALLTWSSLPLGRCLLFLQPRIGATTWSHNFGFQSLHPPSPYHARNDYSRIGLHSASASVSCPSSDTGQRSKRIRQVWIHVFLEPHPQTSRSYLLVAQGIARLV